MPLPWNGMKAKALLLMRGRFFFGLIHCYKNPSSDQAVNERSNPFNGKAGVCAIRWDPSRSPEKPKPRQCFGSKKHGSKALRFTQNIPHHQRWLQIRHYSRPQPLLIAIDATPKRPFNAT